MLLSINIYISIIGLDLVCWSYMLVCMLVTHAKQTRYKTIMLYSPSVDMFICYIYEHHTDET